MVEVEIGGMRCKAVGTEWPEGEEPLLGILRQDLLMRRAPLTYDPFPALTIAQEAIERYGGRIVRQDPPEHEEGRIY